jgi:hypothetical protein
MERIGTAWMTNSRHEDFHGEKDLQGRESAGQALNEIEGIGGRPTPPVSLSKSGSKVRSYRSHFLRDKWQFL